MSESLIKRNAEGLTQNTVANMITPYINSVVTAMVVWVLPKIETITSWSAASKITLIVSVAVGLTFLLHTLPILFRRRNAPSTDQTQPELVLPESARLIEVRDDLDAMTRNRDATQRNLETCWAEQKATLEKLVTCESQLKHWKGEVDRVRLELTNRLETANTQWKEAAGEVSNLQQKLRVAEDKLESFNTPRGRLKIKRAEYHIPDKIGLDVTEKLDQMVLEEKLVLSRRYNDMFFPDPYRGVPKHLTIEFSHGTNEFLVMVPEDTLLTLPFPYRIIE